MPPRLAPLLSLLIAVLPAQAEMLRLPTANHALFEPGGEDKFFVGTVGKPWITGTFGCVRTEGRQMHEGLDIRCLQRDRRGEPLDPVLATADGAVAYINTRAGLSNYGNYILLRHYLDGLEIYSLYAHLREVRAGLKVGQEVKAGEPIGVLGRTSNTRQGISKDRAHVHFELDFLLNERFAGWYKKFHPGERNDHGDWNGQNLVAIDPRAVLLAQQAQGDKFSLLELVRRQPELCRVVVRNTNFPWAKRYAPLVIANPRAETEGVAGYEIALNFNGLPFQLIPRAASEITGKGRFQVLSVNEAEQRQNPCRRLVARQGNRWQLTTHGTQLLELLTY